MNSRRTVQAAFLLPVLAALVLIAPQPQGNAGGGLGAGGAGDPTPNDRQPSDAQGEPERPTRVAPADDVTVDLAAPAVELRAFACLEAGYLEQIACSPGTREHESLVVIRARPSDIHAALLLAGFESGRPGRWLLEEDSQSVRLVPPEGTKLDVRVRRPDPENEDEIIEESIRAWVREHEKHEPLPRKPWVFGGSLFRENPEFMGPGEHYVADMTGSIIGLVTFGDEVVGFSQVISDQAAVHEPEWIVNEDHVPPLGTEVTIILKPWPEMDECDDAEVDEKQPEQSEQD